ncbi:MAG: sulfatase-like hydrolase/transferase [Nitrospirae bacterium]|nr:sulfatase-like hydrolase/transferase [Candidatus Troglogloeales bacterium]
MSWHGTFRQFILDLKLWLFCLLLFQCHRLIFLWSLAAYIAKDSSMGDIVLTILSGFRFDAANATYAILIPFFLITLPSYFFDLTGFANRFRVIWGGLVVLLTFLISIISIEYYKEYHNVFDNFLFGLIYDDRVAIFKTIWATYSATLLVSLGIFAVLFFLYLKMSHRWLQQPLSFELFERPRTVPAKIFISLLALVFLVFSGRGSVGRRSLQLKDAGVTRDAFLNKAELNPYTALRYAIENHWEMGKDSGLNQYIDGDLKKAAQLYFPKATPSNNLDDYAQNHAKGPAIAKPAHIFLIVMESYGTWPLLEKYANLRVSDGLKQLAREGIFVPAFLPASSGTITSLGAIITGLPDAGLTTNYRPASRLIYPTAIANQFKKLGYKTQMFYGGYLPWERIADFSKDQGFDEVYGAANMGNWLETKEWGVDDDILFSFINARFKKTESTFALIMTTSNHPPFNVDLEKKGIDLKEVAKELATYKDAPIRLRELGHFKYADNALVNFVRKIEGQMPNSLFVITGDHYGRRHVVPNPPLFERTAVPLVFYGKSVLGNYKRPSHAAGSHIDIAPTLIEMIAPKGFPYYSYGRNIFDSNAPQLGLGNHSVITPYRIFSIDATDNGSSDIVPFNQQDDQGGDSQYPRYKKIYNTALGLAWWRIMRGQDLSLAP